MKQEFQVSFTISVNISDLNVNSVAGNPTVEIVEQPKMKRTDKAIQMTAVKSGGVSRSEILAKARAARAAKSGKPAKTPTSDGPKLTRAEILAKARAARAAKSGKSANA